MICCAIPMLADTEASALTVKTIDGAQSHFALSRNPKVTMTDGHLNIKTTEGTVSFPLQSVESFTYDNSVSIVNSVISHDSFEIKGNILHISATNVPQDISISAANGIVMDSFRIEAGRSTDISLSAYQSGIYILTINGNGAKIAVP